MIRQVRVGSDEAATVTTSDITAADIAAYEAGILEYTTGIYRAVHSKKNMASVDCVAALYVLLDLTRNVARILASTMDAAIGHHEVKGADLQACLDIVAETKKLRGALEGSVGRSLAAIVDAAHCMDFVREVDRRGWTDKLQEKGG